MPAAKLLKETTSRCPVCLSPIPARVMERDDQVLMRKTCPKHGQFDVVLATDPSFYHLARGRSAGDACCAPAQGCDSQSLFETLSISPQGCSAS